MADPRFYALAGPFSVGDIAQRIGAELAPGAEAGRLIRNLATLGEAGSDDLSFLENRRYLEAFGASRAGACVVERAAAARAPKGMTLLFAARPRRAYALAASLFYPARDVKPGVHPRATVDTSAKLGPGVTVEAGAVIAAAAEIGRGCRIGANAVIGPGVVLGDDSVVGANASISHALIGARVVIYAGVRIGTDGFGFDPSPEGHLRMPQLGRVIIGDDVEVGANSTIDRGSGRDTVIGRGCMIDNLVQIGHNVQLGEGCILVGQSGIAGSARLGRLVTLAGQAGISGHLEIGDGATIGPQAGVTHNVAAGQTVLGAPAIPALEFARQVATLKRLAAKKGK
ncbi:MAG: UDP-3-O-(3-hydroxymyristoyl)glucosamine N-acyltransferase [Proteobacteria bacterium]|nr:UDP-3-O-(3-hydroxymyristoyl)glucosamine N-acyltransferase [Pseudomonadota bacterium]MBI3496888.1 UDP-3-O-(3-hydroxymyristoyl)glucosamine N-acyltransferase [Pseudomonadota bacterium]